MMVMQTARFLKGEANAWYHRNKHKFRPDEIIPLLFKAEINPSYALEFGCADGRRLAEIKKAFPEANCVGIDPSPDAVYHGSYKYQDIKLLEGSCNIISYDIYAKYDLVIYGFCLYVCDPWDLSKIAMVGDNILNDQGYLVIHDFDPDHPHKVEYEHEPGLFSYKMDYSKLWLANPAYSLVSKTKIDADTAVWILKKDIDAGWPLEQLK